MRRCSRAKRRPPRGVEDHDLTIDQDITPAGRGAQGRDDLGIGRGDGTVVAAEDQDLAVGGARDTALPVPLGFPRPAWTRRGRTWRGEHRRHPSHPGRLLRGCCVTTEATHPRLLGDGRPQCVDGRCRSVRLSANGRTQRRKGVRPGAMSPPPSHSSTVTPPAVFHRRGLAYSASLATA